MLCGFVKMQRDSLRHRRKSPKEGMVLGGGPLFCQVCLIWTSILLWKPIEILARRML